MQITVLLEPIANNGYRASSGAPLSLSVEGTSREEALKNLRKTVESRLSNGVEVTTLVIAAAEHPLRRWAGWLKDDPLFDEWQDAMKEYRKEKDQEEGL